LQQKQKQKQTFPWESCLLFWGGLKLDGDFGNFRRKQKKKNTQKIQIWGDFYFKTNLGKR